MSIKSINRPRIKPEGSERQGDLPSKQEAAFAFDVNAELANAGLDLVFLGEVSEKASNKPTEFKPSSQDGNSASDQKAKARVVKYQKWREQLINSNPNEEVMIRDIKAVLDRKMVKLVSEEAKLKSKGLAFINDYNKVVSKIRNLNRLLAEVVESGYRALKALWLRIVHGIV